MSAPVRIRNAAQHEKRALEELQREASLANEGDREFLLSHPDAIDLPQAQIDAGHVIVAERDGALAGFAVILPREDGAQELDGLFVAPKHQRQGIASALVEEASRIAAARGAETLWVTANAHALGFYKAAGFHPIGETVSTRFADAPLMKKPLTAP